MTSRSLTKEEFETHLNREHRLSAFSTYLKEIVYGGVDGIVTTFAVVAGFTGAQSEASIATASIATVLLFGLANLFADAASMGLGNVLSVRADQDVYKQEKEKERREIRKNPQAEMQETVFVLKEKGFTDAQAKELAKIYATNESYWLEFMMNHELEMPNPEGDRPLLTGISTFLSFIIFGCIPLLPYILFRNDPDIFVISAVSSFGALVLLGLLRLRVTKESMLRSVGEIVVLGSVAGSIAYFVGTFFRG